MLKDMVESGEASALCGSDARLIGGWRAVPKTRPGVLELN